MSRQKQPHQYDDIIHLPHPTSKNHPRMSLTERAAQFSPFAALTGYDAAVKETARLTDRRIELDEYEKDALNEKLSLIREMTGCRKLYPEVRVIWFLPDERKKGGAYIETEGCVRRTDEYAHRIVMTDGTCIPVEEILRIELKPDGVGDFL